MRWLLLVLCLCLVPVSALAEDLFVGQSAAGLDDGSSCANQKAVTWFNTLGNWGVGANKISAGDTVHLCGTITSQMVGKASGSAGNVITILFEDNAKMSSAAFSTAGGYLYLASLSYFVIDGGTNGIIENTDVGSGRQQVATTGIFVSGASHIEVKNLTFQNFYIHDVFTDNVSGVALTTAGALYSTGANVDISVHNNTFSNLYWALNLLCTSGATCTSMTAYNNTFTDTCIPINVGTGGAVTIQWTVHDNSFGTATGWPSSGNTPCHVNALHFYQTLTTPQASSDVTVYNNTCTNGSAATSCFYFEPLHSGTQDCSVAGSCWVAKIFNNIFLQSGATSNPANGFMALSLQSGSLVANNTMVINSTLDNFAGINALGKDLTIKNNVISGCDSPKYITYLGVAVGSVNYPSTLADVDYNIYANCTATGVYAFNGTRKDTLSLWQTLTGQESHSQYFASAGLDSNGLPTSGIAVSGTAANLTSLGITALNSDKTGAARPGVGAWDAGAIQFTVVAPASTLTKITNPSATSCVFIWTANTTIANLLGYNIFSGTTTGVYNKIVQKTPASAAAAHTPLLQYTFVFPTAGTYYITVTGYSATEESPRATEVTCTSPGFSRTAATGRGGS